MKTHWFPAPGHVTRSAVALLAIIVVMPVAAAASLTNAGPGCAGSLDLGFAPAGGIGWPGYAPWGRFLDALAIQPDGKVLIGGAFTDIRGFEIAGLARVNRDGSLDTSFLPAVQQETHAIALQHDGRILAGVPYDPVRFLTNGALDLSFQFVSFSGWDGSPTALALDIDGSVLMAGYYNDGTNSGYTVARLSSSGTRDPAFRLALRTDAPIRHLLARGDWQYIAVTESAAYCLSFTGDVLWSETVEDAGLKTGVRITSAVLQPDRQLLLGYSPSSSDLLLEPAVRRLDWNGMPDPTFNPHTFIMQFGEVTAMAVQQDGRILVGGRFLDFSGVRRTLIAQLNPDGSLDPNFEPDIVVNTWADDIEFISAMALRADGEVVLAGYFTVVNGVQVSPMSNRNGLIQLITDPSNCPGIISLAADPIIVNENNSAALVTIVRTGNADRIATVQYSISDGSPTWTPEFGLATAGVDFNPGGGTITFAPGETAKTVPLSLIDDLLLEPNEKLRVTLTEASGAVLKTPYLGGLVILDNESAGLPGSVDASFIPNLGPAGRYAGVERIALQPDGKLLISGEFVTADGGRHDGFARLNSNGRVDNGFATPHLGRITGLALNATGTRILESGDFSGSELLRNMPLVQLYLNGQIDPAFSSTINGRVDNFIVQSNGQIVVAGAFTQVNGTPRTNIARLNADGTLNGGFRAAVTVRSLWAVQPDGKILVSSSNLLSRLNADGSLDTQFASVPAWGILTVALQPDGRILVGGYYAPGTAVHGIARLNADGTPDSTFSPTLDYSTVLAIAVQPNGKLIVGGIYGHSDTNRPLNIARLTATGAADPTFHPGTGLGWHGIHALALLPNGDFVAGGGLDSANNLPRTYLARIAAGEVSSNVPPQVTIVSPTAHSAFARGTPVMLGATAQDQDGVVVGVAFYEGTNRIGDAAGPYKTVPPEWRFEWTNAPVGSHALVAVATDDRGAVASSAAVDFRVTNRIDLLRGFLRREVYTNIPGPSLADLTSNPKYPNQPDLVTLVPSFESPSEFADNYGQRLAGYVFPPVTGDYVFYLSSDDQGALYLSTDELPEHKALIASEPTWSPPRMWQSSPTRTNSANISAPIRLEAGRYYYVEAIMKEAGGGDGLGVAWKLPGGTAPANGDPPIGGYFLSPYPPYPAPALAPPVVSITAPTNGAVMVAPPVVVVSAEANYDPAATEHSLWLYRNNTNGIGGAVNGGTNSYLAISSFLYDLAPGLHRFTAVAADNSGNNVTSAPVTILVAAASSAPSIVIQPASQTLLPGQTAVMSVTATGAPPLSYRWFYNGSLLPSATNPAVVLSNVQPAQSGQYVAIVSNLFGSVTSSPATLTVTATLVGARELQEHPAVATDGTSYFIVWMDRRNRRSSWTEYDIYGARVTPAGTVLDPNGIPICTNALWQSDPAIAFDGTNYLVVWSDIDTNSEWTIRGARVSRGGQLLDTNGITICNYPGLQSNPRVAFNGSVYLVVWNEWRNMFYDGPNLLTNSTAPDIYGARISRSGAVLDTNGFPIVVAPAGQWGGQVATLSNDFLVVWQDDNVLRGARVTPQGAVSNAMVMASGHSSSPAGHGISRSCYPIPGLLAWTEIRVLTNNFYFTDIYASRINSSGASFFTTLLASNAGYPNYVAPASSPAGYWMVWDTCAGCTNSDIRGAWIPAISDSGTPLPFMISTEAGQQDQPAIACNSNGCLVAWRDARAAAGNPYPDEFFDIYATILSPTGGVNQASGFLVSSVLAAQAQPIVTWPPPLPIVYGTPLGTQLNATANVPGSFVYNPPAGTLLNAGSHTLSVTFTPQSLSNYTVVSTQVSLVVQRAPLTITADNKTRFAGQSNPGLTASYAGFVAGDGPASLDAPVTLTTSATLDSPPGVYPIVAAGASDANYNITFVNGTLTIVSTATPAPDNQEYASVASDGSSFFAVWMDRRHGGGAWTDYDVYGTRISAAGQVLDPGGIPICTWPGPQWYPSVAFDGNNYFVVWASGQATNDLFGARVDRSGAVLDTNAIQITHGEICYQPSVAFNGTDYLVAAYSWQHNGVQAATLLGVRVTPAGVVRDTEELVLHSSGMDYPAIVACSGTNWLVAWNRQAGGVEGELVYPNGSLSAPVTLASTGATWVRGLSAVGTNYFLATTRMRDIADDTAVMDVYGTWISRSGVAGNTFLVAPYTNAVIGSHELPTRYIQDHASPAALGSDAVVVWDSGTIYTNGGIVIAGANIIGARVSRAGSISPVFPVCTAPQEQSMPAIAYSGSMAFVVWQDARTASANAEYIMQDYDIYGARILFTNAVVPPNGFLLSSVAVPLQVVLNWPAPAPIAYGTPLSPVELNATANVPGSFLYSPPLGAILDPGQHTLRVTFTPQSPLYSVVSTQVSLTVVPYVTRQLPAVYQSGIAFEVRLICAPGSNVTAQAVQDGPPAGWVVTGISDGGVFDPVTGTVKFGPFFDHRARTLTYTAIPSGGGCVARQFSGTASIDGVALPIVGNSTIECVGYHPADLSAPYFHLTIAELTAYGAAWQRGDTWPQAPNPIPINYVTRAATLWRAGECYQVDPGATNPPMIWIPCVLAPEIAGLAPAGAIQPNIATGPLPESFVPGEPIAVEISASPSANAKAFALEDQLPTGWAANDLSDGGVFDPGARKVKWGPFLDHTARMLTYRALPPCDADAAATFSGVMSADGQSIAIGGSRTLQPSSRFTVRAVTNGIACSLSGTSGKRYVIEGSDDLIIWTSLHEVLNRTGQIDIIDTDRSRPQRFYRARLVE